MIAANRMRYVYVIRDQSGVEVGRMLYPAIAREAAARNSCPAAPLHVTEEREPMRTNIGIPVCDYCEAAPATGYVRAYDAHVCQPCYDDHHGRG